MSTAHANVELLRVWTDEDGVMHVHCEDQVTMGIAVAISCKYIADDDQVAPGELRQAARKLVEVFEHGAGRKLPRSVKGNTPS